MTTQKPLASGFTCIAGVKDLGYPIRQSLESLEPLCDEIVISLGLPKDLKHEALQELEKLKASYNHPKFIFVEYNGKWSGRWGQRIFQWHKAKALCRGKTKIGLLPGRELAKSQFQKLHNRTVLKFKNKGLSL